MRSNARAPRKAIVSNIYLFSGVRASSGLSKANAIMPKISISICPKNAIDIKKLKIKENKLLWDLRAYPKSQ